MLEIISLVKLNLAIIFSIFLPGWLILNYFFKKNIFSLWEKITFSVGLSLFSINFFFIFLNRLNLPFSWNAGLFIGINSLGLVFYFLQKKKQKTDPQNQNLPPKKIPLDLVFWLILIGAIIFRVAYLSDKVIPSSTDLGHHMYWSKSIIDFDRLPDYGMPDFIIGEHIVFALIGQLSGWSLISALPMALLFLFNVLSLLAFFALVKKSTAFLGKPTAQQIASLALLIGGTFYAFSSPQTSFVSGGVIGNILGNFFIPLILLSFLRAFEEKDKNLAIITVLLSATLAYTHHLSSYVLLFVWIFFFGFLFLNDLSQSFLKEKSRLLFSLNFWKTFFSFRVILAVFLFIGFVLFIEPPSYLNKEAIDVAVGAPSKETRTGYDWPALRQALGDWRAFNGIIGLTVLLGLYISSFLPFSQKKSWQKNIFSNKKPFLFSVLLALAWAISLFLMSWAPQWLKTDIPSRRIVSYLTWPTSFLAASGLYFFFQKIKASFPKKSAQLFFFIILAAGFFSSNQESKPYLLSNTDNSEAYQTFAAADYLAEKSQLEEKILKDHIYLKGDTWVKLFLMRGYNEPLSRTNLSRYDDPVKPRETCTRDIVANPDSETGRKCLAETDVKYVLLRKDRDDQNFKKSSAWSKVFSNQKAVIFFYNQQ